jgi:hypothetical protein
MPKIIIIGTPDTNLLHALIELKEQKVISFVIMEPHKELSSINIVDNFPGGSVHDIHRITFTKADLDILTPFDVPKKISLQEKKFHSQARIRHNDLYKQRLRNGRS